jgi:outer membrane biosynthesis protein TonB
MISLVFHVVIIGLLAWFAARGGMLGQPLKQITVRLMPPPVPEKAPVPEKPKPEMPTEKSIPLAEAAPPQVSAPAPVKSLTPVPETPPAVAAPAPAEMPSLVFDDGGKTVQTEKDPAALYRSFVEFCLRSRWNRPTDIADSKYIAEIEIAVDAGGRISAPRWKHKSGDTRWDASVLEAIAQTKTLGRPPPTGFPARMTVRFDVVQSTELNIP